MTQNDDMAECMACGRTLPSREFWDPISRQHDPMCSDCQIQLHGTYDDPHWDYDDR